MSTKSSLEIALEIDGYQKIEPHLLDLPNNEDWQEKCTALYERHIFYREKLASVVRDLGLDANTAHYLLKLLCKEDPQISRHCVAARNGQGRTPPYVVLPSAQLRASSIGHAIYQQARRDGRFVEDVVMIYAKAVSSDQQIELSSFKMAPFGNKFCEFVERLKIDGLKIRIVGFRNAKNEQSDIEAWLRELGLPADTPSRFLRARNVSAASVVRHVAIEVCRTLPSGKLCVDSAFFCTTILAAIVEVWRFAAEDKTYPAF